jgi:thioredoxin reductase (NADPH)
MARPALLTVDDDPEVLAAVERDLRKHYARDYRVLRADSGPAALDALRQLKERGETVALMLVDQRMPGMSGVEFLAEAMQFFPDAKRVLLTAYADTEAAIAAINKVRLDYYILKPWDPPAERLYPVLDDLLSDWKAGYRPPFGGVRVYGPRWSSEAHRIRDFLASNLVPFQNADLVADPAVRAWLEQNDPQAVLSTTVVLPDGVRLVNPTNIELADKLGLRRQPDRPFYDLVIVGGGPGGLAAAVYGASEGLNTVLVEQHAPGGQAGSSSRIENYLGFPAGLSGGDLARRAVAQVLRFGAEILSPLQASALKLDGPYKIVTLSDGNSLSAHAVLVATGVSYRKLDLPGADRLNGAGVYYGSAMTEAGLCRGEEVYIVGGGNSAGQAAMYLSRHVKMAYIVVRGDGLARNMSQYLIDQLKSAPNITVVTCCRVTAVSGDECLEKLTLTDDAGRSREVPTKALFVFIGARPYTDWLDGLVRRDPHGFLMTGPDLLVDGKRPAGWPLDRDPLLPETSVPGVFAAGDVRAGSVKRVASAVGEGSAAVQAIHQYLLTVR